MSDGKDLSAKSSTVRPRRVMRLASSPLDPLYTSTLPAHSMGLPVRQMSAEEEEKLPSEDETPVTFGRYR